MRKAFTLNELLIAVAVIGIILIITVPIVISHFSKKTQVVELQRTYTLISNAIRLMQVDERVKSISRSSLYYTSDSSLDATAGNFLKTYLKVSQDCGDEPGECFASSYKNLSGAEVSLPDDVYCVSLSTGASVCLTPPGFTGSGDSGKLIIDVNGAGKPNIIGRDFFILYIYLDGFIGDRISSTDNVSTCRADTYGSGCFNRIINADWTMDY